MQGELTWKPFASPAINALKIRLLMATDRPLSGPAYQLSKPLAHDLEELRRV